MPTGALSLGRRALPIALALLLAAPADGRAQPGEWLRYGLNDGGTRYLRGGEITPDNVARLEVAWSYHTGDLGAGFRSPPSWPSRRRRSSRTAGSTCRRRSTA